MREPAVNAAPARRDGSGGNHGCSQRAHHSAGRPSESVTSAATEGVVSMSNELHTCGGRSAAGFADSSRALGSGLRLPAERAERTELAASNRATAAMLPAAIPGIFLRSITRVRRGPGTRSIGRMLSNGTQHGVQPIPPCRAEMLRKADLVDESVAGAQDGLRCETGVRPQQDRDQAADNCGITGGLKVQQAVAYLRAQPNLRLAAFDLVLVRLEFLREAWQSATKVDDVLVAVHPVIEEFELVYDLAMYGLD